MLDQEGDFQTPSTEASHFYGDSFPLSFSDFTFGAADFIRTGSAWRGSQPTQAVSPGSGSARAAQPDFERERVSQQPWQLLSAKRNGSTLHF
jgi:hypothetical protein